MAWQPTYRPPVTTRVFAASDPQLSDPAPDGVTNYTYVDDNGRSVLVLGQDRVVQPHLDATALGVKDSGSDDDADANTLALDELLTRARTLNASVRLPGAVVPLGRSGTTGFHIRTHRDVRIWGEHGKTVLRAKADAANGGGECKGLRIDDSDGVWIDGVVIDGGWANAATSVADESHLIEFVDGMTIAVEDTEGLAPFPDAGTFELITEQGKQDITYTGRSAKSFTGCTGGSGTLRAGDEIVRFSMYRASTTVASGSNGANINASTLNVGDTSDFPQSDSVVGRTRVTTSNGYAFITWTGKNATQLTGVTAHSGSGTVSTGAAISYLAGAGGQLPTLPSDWTNDAKNHNFVYGSDGNAKTPNRRIRITNSTIVNMFGDGLWIGQYSYDSVVENARIYLCARNGITLSSFADGVALNNVTISHCHTTAIDAEPVEGPSSRVRMYNVHATSWPNPGTENLNIVLSIVGGSALRPGPQNKCQDWRLVNCSFTRGSTLLENCDGVAFVNCKLDNAIRIAGATAGPALHISGETTNARFIGCDVFGVHGDGAVVIKPYRIGGTISGQVHSALAPSNVTFDNCSIRARNGVAGVYYEAGGGYPGIEATALSYVAPSFTLPSGPNVPGELVFAAGTFTGKVDYYVGRRVRVAGLLANVVANDTDTLYLAPYAENYRQIDGEHGYAWIDALGRVATPPSFPATATVLPAGGPITFSNTTIDCAADDDWTAGGRGFYFDTTTNFEEGFNQVKISADITVHGATGEAVYIRGRGPSSPGVCSELDLSVRVRDEQPTKTTTVGVRFDYPQIWSRIAMPTIDVAPGIEPMQGHEDISSWISQASWPPRHTGYSLPEGNVFAPIGSTFVYPPGNATYVKKTSEDYATGWTRVKTDPRIAYAAAGTFPAGSQASLTVPPPARIASATEFLVVLSNNAYGAVVLSDAKGFEPVATDTDMHLGFTIRLSIFARDMSTESGSPVIDASGGNFAVARIVSIDDLLPGDVADSIDASTTLTHASGATSFSFGLPTSTVPEALVVAFIATHTGGSPTSNLTGLATDEEDVIELQANLDAGQATLGDRYSISVITGRRSDAGSFGTLTGSVNVTSPGTYAFTMGVALVLKPKEES